MAEINTYSPKEWDLEIAGFALHGYADDSFISFDPREDVSELTVGADGESTIHVSPDDGGTLSVTLKATSQANAVLQEWVSAWQAGRGLGSFRIGDNTFDANKVVVGILKNRFTNEEVALVGVVPAAFPNMEASRQAPDREWRFHVASAKRSRTQISVDALNSVQDIN